jgi:hypothetical protein
MGEQVLEVLKRRIKTNYDQLYSNYPDNKAKIFKQIQTVETNISGENAMSHKYEEVIKEKGKFDKLKATVEDKQRKLKKVAVDELSFSIFEASSCRAVTRRGLAASPASCSCRGQSSCIRKKKKVSTAT